MSEKELVAAGDLPGAYRALAQAAGVPPGRVPDFKVRVRDPRQDMQYGETLALAEDAAPYRAARKFLARVRENGVKAAALELLCGATEAMLGEPTAARAFLDKALALEPSCALALAWRGAVRSLECRAAREQKGLPAALKDLDRAIALNPAAAEFARPWRVELRHDMEDPQGALEDLDVMLTDDPSDTWARVERGEILCESRRLDEALAEFDRLVTENPKAAWALALRGRTLATSGMEAMALRDLERAVTLSPRSAATLSWLSEALRKLGRYKEALKRLDAAVRCDPKFTLAWLWRGRVLLALGRPKEALRDLERAIKLDPRYQLAFAWRGEAYFKVGRLREAAADFDKIAPMDVRRTWNPAAVEGLVVDGEARARSYWDDVSRVVQRKPRDAWARKLWERALARVPTSLPVRESAGIAA